MALAAPLIPLPPTFKTLEVPVMVIFLVAAVVPAIAIPPSALSVPVVITRRPSLSAVVLVPARVINPETVAVPEFTFQLLFVVFAEGWFMVTGPLTVTVEEAPWVMVLSSLLALKVILLTVKVPPAVMVTVFKIPGVPAVLPKTRASPIKVEPLVKVIVPLLAVLPNPPTCMVPETVSCGFAPENVSTPKFPGAAVPPIWILAQTALVTFTVKVAPLRTSIVVALVGVGTMALQLVLAEMITWPFTKVVAETITKINRNMLLGRSKEVFITELL